MAGDISFHLLRALKAALMEQPPYRFGILEVPPDSFKLYYGRDEARFIDLQEASKSNDHGALEALAQACEPTPFGRGEETVLDGTYRKAGKLDVKDFMTGLDLEKTGLLDTVRLGLPSGRDEGRTIHAELYKSNVYGEGAFFKPHKDTPRGQDMFGSLVVIFPTPHEGGTLVFRHENIEHPFDATDMLSQRPDYVAYAAFFSDVEHEVAPVTSGHRVTLTYNLYSGAAEHPAVPAGGHLALRPFHASTPSIQILRGFLLEAPTFLPQGGTLGFGLRHAYPFPKVWTSDMPDPLAGLQDRLKGSDAALLEACIELGPGLAPDLRLVRDGLDGEIMLGGMVELGPLPVEDPARELVGSRGSVLPRSLAFTPGDARGPWSDLSDLLASSAGGRGFGRTGREYDERDGEVGLTVHWVTLDDVGGGVRSPYVAYGNEATLEWLYMRVCLLVKIGPHGSRSEKGDPDMGEEGLGGVITTLLQMGATQASS